MKRKLCALLIVALVLGLGSYAPAQDSPADQLAKKMPAGANAVMVVNLAQIRQSELAQKEQWFDSISASVESGMAFLPQKANVVVIGSRIDYETFEPDWSCSFITLDSTPPMSAIQSHMNGVMDKVAGFDVVQTNSDMFVFEPFRNTLGTYIPSNRQNFAAWLNQISNDRSTSMSKYLEQGLRYSNQGADVIMAFDLEHVVGASNVLARAQDAELLQSNNIDPKAFSNLVASIQGVSVGATVKDKIMGTLKIDFGHNAQLLAPVAKQLVLEIMENHGLQVAELSTWEPNIQGNSLTLSGPLSKSTLRKMISVFEAPEPHLTEAASTADDTDSTPSANDVGSTTRRYFDSVNSLIH